MRTQGERRYGNAYNEGLSRKDIATLMRTWIKEQIKADSLPKGTYSVTCPRGKTIEVVIKEFEFPIMNVNRLQWHKDNPNGYRPPIADCPYTYSRYTKIAELALKSIQTKLDSYNFDGSDAMTDYFDVNFYGFVKFDYALERKETEAWETNQ